MDESVRMADYLAMRVPLLDLGEQYRALSEPIREAIDEVLASHVLFSDQNCGRSKRQSPRIVTHRTP